MGLVMCNRIVLVYKNLVVWFFVIVFLVGIVVGCSFDVICFDSFYYFVDNISIGLIQGGGMGWVLILSVDVVLVGNLLL